MASGQGYSTPVHTEQGGTVHVIGANGLQNVEDGGAIVVQSGGLVSIEAGGAIDIEAGGQIQAAGVQASHIADVPTAGSAAAADNATAINAILAALEGVGILASA